MAIERIFVVPRQSPPLDKRRRSTPATPAVTPPTFTPIAHRSVQPEIVEEELPRAKVSFPRIHRVPPTPRRHLLEEVILDEQKTRRITPATPVVAVVTYTPLRRFLVPDDVLSEEPIRRRFTRINPPIVVTVFTPVKRRVGPLEEEVDERKRRHQAIPTSIFLPSIFLPQRRRLLDIFNDPDILQRKNYVLASIFIPPAFVVTPFVRLADRSWSQPLIVSQAYALPILSSESWGS